MGGRVRRDVVLICGVRYEMLSVAGRSVTVAIASVPSFLGGSRRVTKAKQVIDLARRTSLPVPCAVGAYAMQVTSNPRHGNGIVEPRFVSWAAGKRVGCRHWRSCAVLAKEASRIAGRWPFGACLVFGMRAIHGQEIAYVPPLLFLARSSTAFGAEAMMPVLRESATVTGCLIILLMTDVTGDFGDQKLLVDSSLGRSALLRWWRRWCAGHQAAGAQVVPRPRR